MIPGFNLDIKHKGKTFHIQTEDSGPANPVIMTHLFLFGTILGSRRLEYTDAVGRADMADHVRELMRAELKAMHQALLAGEYDELARRPQKKAGTDIPLARKSGSGQIPLVARPSAAPAPSPAVAGQDTPLVMVDPAATLDADDLIDASDMAESVDGEPELVAELESMEMMSVADDLPELSAPSPAAVEDRGTLPARLPGMATPVRPRATVEFPTELVAETRFDDVILAWLLEDVDEA